MGFFNQMRHNILFVCYIFDRQPLAREHNLFFLTAFVATHDRAHFVFWQYQELKYYPYNTSGSPQMIEGLTLKNPLPTLFVTSLHC